VDEAFCLNGGPGIRGCGLCRRHYELGFWILKPEKGVFPRAGFCAERFRPGRAKKWVRCQRRPQRLH
jgi:hypothetical protein